MPSSSYVLITPAKNEELHIRKTLETVTRQTYLPKLWVIVSDGSTDRTDEFVAEFARRHEFIRLVRLDSTGAREFSRQAVASTTGYETVRGAQFDLAGFLDADISLAPNYYGELIAEFEVNSKLGIAGGVIVEDHDGQWKMRHCDSADYVAGALQMFRRRCYEEIGGFVPLRWGGHDTVANTMASRRGWEVRAFSHLQARHHRRTGTAGTTVHRSRFRQGLHDYFMGYHPLFELAKCVRRIIEPPYVSGSLFHFCGYIWPYFIREKPGLPADLVRYLRRQQIQRLLGAGGNL
jgi:glycosyltransferase involved in cell wall biosynthesis